MPDETKLAKPEATVADGAIAEKQPQVVPVMSYVDASGRKWFADPEKEIEENVLESETHKRIESFLKSCLAIMDHVSITLYRVNTSTARKIQICHWDDFPDIKDTTVKIFDEAQAFTHSLGETCHFMVVGRRSNDNGDNDDKDCILTFTLRSKIALVIPLAPPHKRIKNFLEASLALQDEVDLVLYQTNSSGRKIPVWRSDGRWGIDEAAVQISENAQEFCNSLEMVVRFAVIAYKGGEDINRSGINQIAFALGGEPITPEETEVLR